MTLAPGGSRLVDTERHRAGDVDRTELLALAESAAASAAGLLREATVDEAVLECDDAAQGLVTALDRAAEARIRETILFHRPDDAMLGEELGRIPGCTGIEWIVDPIDGTVNFVAGLSQWAVSIAVRVHGSIAAAVVHAPCLGHVYTALAGVGAWRNGVPLSRPVFARRLGDAVIATGFAVGADRRAEQLEQMTQVLGAVRDIRCHGAASIELCKVAAGELDAYYESHLQIWDVAAGALVAMQAGVDIVGSPWAGEGTLVAAPSVLMDQLGQIVRSSLPSLCSSP